MRIDLIAKVICITICTVAPAMAEDEVVGFSVPSLANSFWVSAAFGVQSAADDLGVELVILDAGGDANAVQQISQIQDLIQRDVDAIVVGATNGEIVAPIVGQAIAQGIEVVGLSSPPAIDGLAAVVSADHFDMGRLQAECMGAALNGAGQVAMMAGPQGQIWSDRRADGFRETIESAYPDIEIIAESRLADNRTAALRVAEDWSQRFPEIDGVYSATDDMAAGVIAAFEPLENDGIVFTASNLSPTAQDMIATGALECTSIQMIVAQGRAAVEAAVTAARGGEVAPSLVTPAVLVNATNLETVDLSNVVAPSDYRP